MDFVVRVTTATDGAFVFTVPPPDSVRETLVPLISDDSTPSVQKLIHARMGHTYARASLFRWRVEGCPVRVNGPRVRLPTLQRGRRVYSTVEAITRFLQVLDAVEVQVADAGSVPAFVKQHGRDLGDRARRGA